jgi:nuclear RNA export factor
MPNQRKLEWKAWIENGSRNLHRLSGEKTISALHIGQQDIVQALVKLPLTKHDILGAPENFCVDAFLAGVGLLVIVHGQFIEGRLFPC